MRNSCFITVSASSCVLTSNNAFERPWGVGGPLLAAAEASCLAAQLGR
jgi:hypothetical protein